MKNENTKAALLVIDMQRGFLDPASPLFIEGAPATVDACARAIALCREKDVSVIFVTRRYAADGSDVELARREAWEMGGKPLSPGCDPAVDASMPAVFGSTPGDYHIVKPRYSAFFATPLDLILRRLEIGRVILTGTTTPNCIRATCFDGLSLDYDVTVLSDCTSSRTEEIQEANLRDMAAVGARIQTLQEFRQSLAE
ncbi:MAG: cysteine hydrolase [Oscillospiraceae bacterium]|nr:cysteine hydrolase [Oscillospiraceae bacterium]